MIVLHVRHGIKPNMSAVSKIREKQKLHLRSKTLTWITATISSQAVNTDSRCHDDEDAGCSSCNRCYDDPRRRRILQQSFTQYTRRNSMLVDNNLITIALSTKCARMYRNYHDHHLNLSTILFWYDMD